MTDSANPHIRLGIFSVIGDSLGLFFRRFPLFFMIAVIPSAALTMLAAWLNPPQLDPTGTDILWEYDTVPELLLLLVEMLAYVIVIGITTLAAYDRLTGRPVRIAAYLLRCLESVPAIAVLGLAFYLLMFVGLIFLVLPGLYFMARYGVFVPAILIDRAGFSGLGRAASLSQGYRWPIIGGLVLVFLVLLGFSVLVSMLFGVFTGLFSGGAASVYGLSLLEAVISAVVNAFSAVFTALLYARLREIKEGLGIRDLVEVFA